MYLPLWLMSWICGNFRPDRESFGVIRPMCFIAVQGRFLAFPNVFAVDLFSASPESSCKVGF